MNSCDYVSGLNTNLVPKPHVCASCVKDDDPHEEFVCFLCRVDQQGEPKFICAYYEGRSG